jgi:hypothetical protein
MAAKLRMKTANGREYARMNTNNRAVEPQIDQASLKEEMGGEVGSGFANIVEARREPRPTKLQASMASALLVFAGSVPG